MAKTQARENDKRRQIYLEDNFKENPNSSKIIKLIPFDNFKGGFNPNNNENIKPVYLFTEVKKNEYYNKNKMVRSPIVKKINFLKTILDDDFNY